MPKFKYWDTEGVNCSNCDSSKKSSMSCFLSAVHVKKMKEETKGASNLT